MTRLSTSHSIGAIALGLLLVGNASTAHAAPLTSTSVTSTGSIGTAGTNATPIVVTATTVTGDPSNNFVINLPTGWTFVTPSSGATCEGFISVTGYTLQACQAINAGPAGFAPLIGTAIFAAGTTVTVTFAANSLNVGAGREFALSFADTATGGTTIDSGTATLAGGGDEPEDDSEAGSEDSDTLAETGFDGVTLAGVGLSLLGLGVLAARRSVRRS